ncbi:lipopolysaccharide biosynthesis protein [Pararhizobium mangrovi]|uniref:Lipopolysaccharide biosynthesis protein n=1 Tax=Pararhizobium mangrovi TaxID=2590452 RepID=A0A506U8X1_9HYPH|nr:lipopolysaccharide biosynthesis protein [Pararhizobium mangrovi]TPW29019.1 lipopolysaccharide biosynthesis protein [Pararhizobium mangrovi]
MAVPAILHDRIRRILQGRGGAAGERLVNIGHLLTGNVFGSFLGMLAFMLTARALGPHDYGRLALTFSYIRAVQLLIAFQSWQPLIKYGAELHGRSHEPDYRALMKFGLMVDIGAAMAAFLVAVCGAFLFGSILGISKDMLTWVLIYATTLAFQINGMPTAVLRLAGRFRLTAYGPLAGTSFRVVLCLVGLLTGAGPLYFVVLWTITQIGGAVSILVLALFELHRQGVRQLMSAPLAGVTRKFEGLLGFTIGSNLELSIRSSTNEFDTLLVGFLAGPSPAGFYQITKRLARMVLQLGAQVQAVLYPDIARIWARGELKELHRAVLQTFVMLAGFGVLVVGLTAIGIRPIIIHTAGTSFAAAAPLAVVQMIAAAIMLSGGVLRSALLAMGRQPTVLRIVIVATIIFQLVAVSAIPIVGAMGANLAHMVMALIMVSCLWFVYRRMIQAGKPGDPDTQTQSTDAAMTPS